MKHAFALLGFAAAALVSTVVAQANAPDSVGVQDNVVLNERLPRSLSDFGFFTDAAGREPARGVELYALNTPLWSDGADKLRYIYLPDGAQLSANGEGLLRFPIGSAIIKTFAFGQGDNQRFIETRVLLHRAEGWVALPYRWNEEQTEARLAIAGARIPITTPEGEEISYRIPNKNQCKSCHALDDAVVPIGPQARNLSREWLDGMRRRGLLDAIPDRSDTLPVWQDRADVQQTAELARAYLDVNCAHCHRPGGGASNSGLDLRWEQDEQFAIGVRKPPVAAGRGAGGLLVSIEPGDPDASILVHRMNSTEPGVAMPELGRATIDYDAVGLIRDWISEMDE